MTTTTILWQRLDRPGHEGARLTETASESILEGAAVFLERDQPSGLTYRVVCDRDWRTLRAEVNGFVGGRPVDTAIIADAAGLWRMDGRVQPQVEGCLDIDLNFSPSTNLLPIRRLGLAPGEESLVRAAWLRFPSFALEPLEQTYRRTSENVYRYEASGGGFVVDLGVDANGLVLEYPGFWKAQR